MNQTEDVVCQELKKWFNSYGIICWLNHGDDKFITRKNQKKPDLIIFSSKLNQYVAIEVKKGDVGKDIYDAAKVCDYYKQYLNKETLYIVDRNEVVINSFAVATVFSMFGHLFREENLIEIGFDDQWGILNKKYGLEPY